MRRGLPLALLLGVAACGHRAAAPPGGEPTLPPGLDGHLEPELVGVVHVVKRGETLYRIARAYGVPLADLMEVNDLTDPRQLAAGTELFVPDLAKLASLYDAKGFSVTRKEELKPVFQQALAADDPAEAEVQCLGVFPPDNLRAPSSARPKTRSVVVG